MKAFFLASLLVVAVSASLLQEHAVKFQDFKMVHGKTYLNQVEETKRFSIFRENVRAIEEHNALYEQGLVSYKQKINQFADQTQEEFEAYLTLHPKPASLKNTIEYVKKGVAVPESVDWRQKGQVTPVKNQGGCGSCWAFSMTGSVEGAHARGSGKLVALSEQQLIDCSKEENDGCNGGQLEQNYPYLIENGLQSEESYPYEEEDGLCRYNKSAVVAKPVHPVTIKVGDEDALLEAVATVGPVSVAINANYIGSYHTDVFHDSRCRSTRNDLNHGVLIVGYGTENGKDYWIVKNSWGQDWGDEGYLKMSRGNNECGIAIDTTYATSA